jgi:antitoxin (DNA-binding transcriptional repressor) of toxin-antitoxin stability system
MSRLKEAEMRWKIAEAKQRFSELVRAAEVEPQWIYNRDKPVAAMVPAVTLKEFLSWRRQRETRTVGEAFKELRRICREEDYTLDISPRQERPNPIPDALDELSR